MIFIGSQILIFPSLGKLVKIVPSSGDPCMSYNFVGGHSFVGDYVFGAIFDVRTCNLVHLEDVFITAG